MIYSKYNYVTKPSNAEDPVLVLWWIWSTPPLLLLPGPFSPGVVAPDKVLSMSQIELFEI